MSPIWERVASRWTGANERRLAAAEEAMLRGVQGKVSAEEVLAGADGHTVHTIRAGSSDESSSSVVLLHGLGMGAASWGESFDTLAENSREVLSIDWPGSGRSTRPPFPRGEGVDACENFFVERLEAWRRSLGINRMVLVGHSFGGYFSACYTMRYPERVEHLILASPVGMSEKTGTSAFTDPELRAQLPWRRRALFGFVEHLWTSYWTPQALVRSAGPWGERLVDRYVHSRFSKCRDAGTKVIDDATLKEYLHQLAAQPGCAEYCLGELLDFGAWAKRPLGQRLVSRLLELGQAAPPVTFLYGQHDWMDVGTGITLASNLGSSARVLQVEGAGHQLLLDNPKAFNLALQRAMGKGPEMLPGFYRTCTVSSGG